MKYLIRYACLLLLFVISCAARAQTNPGNKPLLFNNFPSIISCSEAELSKAFTAALNQNISLGFSDNFSFNGVLVNSVVKYNNLTTVIIKSAQYNDAVFALSRATGTDGVSYRGRIINNSYNDFYELKKDAANHYQLIKTTTDKILQVCSQN